MIQAKVFNNLIIVQARHSRQTSDIAASIDTIFIAQRERKFQKYIYNM